MFETIEFIAGGKTLAHSQCRLSASAEEAVRTGEFSVAWNGQGIPCQPGDDATINVSGTLWGTGYVRDVRGEHDPENRSYAVTFVSRTVDAVEASVFHPTGFKDGPCDLMDVAREFDTLKIGIMGSPKTLVKPQHKLHSGETLFDTIELEARAQSILIHDDEKGRLVLADKPEGRHTGALARGTNIISASGQLSERGTFSEVRVRGQSVFGVTKAVLTPETKAKGTARRNRPLIVNFEGDVTSERMKRRADWEARHAAGNAIAATVTVPGWRDEGGNIWTRNWLVDLDDDWLGISQTMIVAEASLEQDSQGGTTATLSLKDPRSLGGQNPRGKSSSGWASPAAASPEYRED